MSSLVMRYCMERPCGAASCSVRYAETGKAQDIKHDKWKEEFVCKKHIFGIRKKTVGRS